VREIHAKAGEIHAIEPGENCQTRCFTGFLSWHALSIHICKSTHGCLDGQTNQKTMSQKFLELGLVIAIVAVIITGFAQTWTSSTASSYWLTVASSADGKVLMTVNSGVRPLFSTNSGSTWSTNASWPNGYGMPTISADGTKLMVPSISGYLNVSTNTGNTWFQTVAPHGDWRAAACTADGTKLFAGTYNGGIWISTNSGSTWQQSSPSSLPNANWLSLATSADGTRIAASGGNQIYVSTNAGYSWQLKTVAGSSVALSADGGVLVVTGNGSTYISTNFGSTWRTSAINGSSEGGASGNSIALSADGKYLALADFNSKIYTSTNSGATWVTNNVSTTWSGIASSADGYRLVAVSAFNQGIWLGQYVPAPQLKLTPSSGNVGLSWTLSSTNFALQQSSNLNNWSTVTNAPVLNLTNLQNQVSLPASNGSTFFRLKTP
jgi:photosystem II stability/assembly factor-like uncharacterized protein